MKINKLVIRKGFPESYRQSAALLYDEAFRQKFSVAIHSDKKRLSLLQDCLNPEYAIVAIKNNDLVGIAGFHTKKGSLTRGITFRDLISRSGILKSVWAALVFSLYERKLKPGELLMDGIAVQKEFRGKGIGSKLLDKIVKYAQENKYEKIRLDVIDTNPEARKLYERKGFEAVKTNKFPFLKLLLGFGSSISMVMDVARY